MGRDNKNGKNKRRGKHSGQDSFGNRLSFDLPKNSFLEGETIVGKVVLDLQTPLGASKLKLKIQGYEKCEWEETKHRRVGEGEDARWESYQEEHEGSRDIFKQKITLFDGGANFEPGHYEYDFNFQLPSDGLPGSFYHKGRRGSDDFVGKVQYKMKAKLDAKKDLGAKQKVFIFDRINQAVQAADKEKTGKVMFLCCIPKGEVTIKADFNKNMYTPGEVAHIMVNCYNESSSNVDKIASKLMRKISLRSDDGHSKDIVATVCNAEYDGVEAGETAENRSCPLQVPSSAHPSSSGRHVSCKYWSDVEAQVPYAPDIEIHLPLTLYAVVPV